VSPIVPPEKKVNFTFDGEMVTAIAGQTLAAAMLHEGVRALRTTRIGDEKRGIFCGIGICFDCLVVIDGLPNQRACLVEVRSGIKVETQNGAGIAL
jgi:predicted molibdopterin-dependent oxidoreductase YjgC